ncbi:hypothetical protein PSDVSF_24290 [Pseudodesulfovibrio sediminis]|uniref:Uncharacterized protein n=2 Tax=Pseudodesulfovibrio sediminis TaxID=2810563 RepID=A0ABN6ES44_9BACT|nr:hypothetical protein PSDVSF_24290 [Pseudodesulfovibrio sediminis]
MKPKVLIIFESYSTAIHMAPVYQALMERGRVEPVVFATFAESIPVTVFEEYGVQFLNVKDVIDDDDREVLNGLRTDYAEIFNAAVEQHGLDTCRYKGVPMLPFIRDEALRLNHMKVFCHRVFKKLVKMVDPALLFVGYCSGGKLKQYVTLANRMGIPTLNLQYGSGLIAKGTSRRELFAQNYCVWGEAFKDLYVDKADKRKNTVVVGDPAFDKYGDIDSSSVREALNISSDKRVILVGLAYLEECKKAASQLVKAQVHPGDVYIFKLHPGQANMKDEYQKVVDSIGMDSRVVAMELSPYELLKISDHYICLEQETLWVSCFQFDVIPTVIESFTRLPIEKHPMPWLFDCCASLESLASIDQLDDVVAQVDRELFEQAKHRLWDKADYKAAPRVASVVEKLAFGQTMSQIQVEMEA